MKLATVTYEGTVRQKTHRGPSGKRYVFGSLDPEIEGLADARMFERKSNYTVEWTAAGKLANKYADGYEDSVAALKDLGYRKKQSLAKKLGVQANQSEEDLEDELEDFAENLQHQLENQPR